MDRVGLLPHIGRLGNGLNPPRVQCSSAFPGVIGCVRQAIELRRGIATGHFFRLFKHVSLTTRPPAPLKTLVLTLAAVGAVGFVAADPPQGEVLDFVAADPPQGEVLDFVAADPPQGEVLDFV